VKDEPQTLAAAIPEDIFSPNVWSKRVLGPSPLSLSQHSRSSRRRPVASIPI